MKHFSNKGGHVVHILRHLKEELVWAVDKKFQFNQVKTSDSESQPKLMHIHSKKLTTTVSILCITMKPVFVSTKTSLMVKIIIN